MTPGRQVHPHVVSLSRRCRVAWIWPGLFLLAGIQLSCASRADPVPPVAKVIPHRMVEHGHTRIDNYYWMRDDTRTRADVLSYLKAENRYFDAVMAPIAQVQAHLYREMAARISPDDREVPVRLGSDWYFAKFRSGKDYPVIVRCIGALDGPQQVVLDANSRAHGGGFYDLGNWQVSEDGRLFAFSEDTVGRERYNIRVRDLATGRLLPDRIDGVALYLAWANDNRSFFYVSLDETLRPVRVHRHVLGTPRTADSLVYEETDQQYDMSLYKSRSRQFVLINLVSTLSTETRLIDADHPELPPRVFLPREPEHRYDIEPVGGTAYVHTNWQAPNYRLMKVSLDRSTDKSAWQEVVAARDDVYLEGFAAFRSHLVLEENHAGILDLRITGMDGRGGYRIESAEPAYTTRIDENPYVDSDVLRYSYTSLATPSEIYDFNMETRQRTLLKQAFAGRDFDRNALVTERVDFAARDGTRVPITLLHRRADHADGTHPLFLLGYGAYGDTYYPEFNCERLSLVNRGFIFALAHIRGGQEYGRRWFEDGRAFHKKNTFTDFIDAADFLTKSGWAAPGKIVGMGRSAGGLLIGAVANMSPQSFGVLITEVPFVDVITTMLDEGIPLTSYEFDEWGNPKNEPDYDYMLSYSPMDQVGAHEYPSMMVTTSLWDARVQYWEPAKWVAKLRAMKTDQHPLLFHVDMHAGHHGSYGRYQRLKTRAREFAFIFETLHVSE